MILACIVGSVSSRFNYAGFSFNLFVNADRYNVLAHVGTKAKIETKWLNFSQSSKDDNDTIVNEYIAAVVGPTPLRANQACPTVATCFTVLEAKWPFVKLIKAELERSNPTHIHEQLVLTQSNPADDQEVESSPIQSGLHMWGNSIYPWVSDAYRTMYLHFSIQSNGEFAAVSDSIQSHPIRLDWTGLNPADWSTPGAWKRL